MTGLKNALSRNYLKLFFVLLIRGYQKFISPFLPNRCKYYPSCSQYAIDAFSHYGVLRGFVLASWRLLRCNPLSNGGFDPIERQKLFKSRTAGIPDGRTPGRQNIMQFARARRFNRATALVVLLVTMVMMTLVFASCSFLGTTTTTHVVTTTAAVTSTTAKVSSFSKAYQGLFTPLANLFFRMIEFLHKSGGISWGWSIVLLTVIVRIVLLPLTWKQLRSMRAMQVLQPQIKALQEKYKNDRELLNQKTMEFYSQNKINPFGSCLPLLLQLPVFIGLYFMLRNAGLVPVSAGGTGLGSAAGAFLTGDSIRWLWIDKITHFDPILMVVYVLTQFLASWQMSRTSQGQQKMIALGMPLFIAVFMYLYHWPAGLFIYWCTTNIWTVAQQFAAEKLISVPTMSAGQVAGGGGSQGGGRFMKMLQQASEQQQTKTAGSQKAAGSGTPAKGSTKAKAPAAKAPSARTPSTKTGGQTRSGTGAQSGGKQGSAKTGTSKPGPAGGTPKKSTPGQPGGQTGGKTSGQQSGQGKTADSQGQRPKRGTGGPKSSS